MRPTIATILVAVALVTAGCIATTDNAPTANSGTGVLAVGPVDPLPQTHDHRDALNHTAIHNMELLAWDPIVEQGGFTGAHAVDIWGDFLFVQTSGDLIGFAILNVSDPANPVEVGRYDNPATKSGDRCIMVSEDGKYVFLAADESEKGGIYAVDITDMANPKLAAYYEIPQYGAHTLYAKMIGGEYYVYALNFGVHILRLTENLLGSLEFELVSRYVAADPVQIAQFTKTDQGGESSYIIRDIYGHDVFVDVDRETNQVLMYVAHAYDGLKIVDITNPRIPREIASWVPEDSFSPYYVHTVHVDWINNNTTRVVAVGSEVFENRHTETPSPVWFLDATELANPKLMSTWTNPGQHGAQGLLFSAHDMRIEHGLVYLSHYHGGIWVLDISTPDLLASPKILGYYASSEDNGYEIPEDCCLGFNLGAMPLFFDVEVKDGIAYGADFFTGVYVLKLQTREAPAFSG